MGSLVLPCPTWPCLWPCPALPVAYTFFLFLRRTSTCSVNARQRARQHICTPVDNNNNTTLALHVREPGFKPLPHHTGIFLKHTTLGNQDIQLPEVQRCRNKAITRVVDRRRRTPRTHCGHNAERRGTRSHVLEILRENGVWVHGVGERPPQPSTERVVLFAVPEHMRSFEDKRRRDPKHVAIQIQQERRALERLEPQHGKQSVEPGGERRRQLFQGRVHHLEQRKLVKRIPMYSA